MNPEYGLSYEPPIRKKTKTNPDADNQIYNKPRKLSDDDGHDLAEILADFRDDEDSPVIKKNEQKRKNELAAKEGYDFKREVDVLDREGLRTIKLRKLHNWIKAVLLNKYTQQLKIDAKKNGEVLKISALDFGCGKGGDLKKWQKVKIVNLVGIDVSLTAVEDAHKRWLTDLSGSFKAKFINVSGNAPEDEFFKNIDEDMYFDIVSCQFALHYLFESEESIHRALTNITKKLTKGGYFICTIPDSNVIIKRIRERGKKHSENEWILGNDYYSIRFNTMRFPKEKIYGINYGFYLDEAVGHKEFIDGEEKITYVTEYLVIFDNFLKIAKEYGLQLEERKNFQAFLKDYVKEKKYYDLFTNMVGSDFSCVDKQLWEISYLYQAVVFKKIEGPSIYEVKREF